MRQGALNKLSHRPECQGRLVDALVAPGARGVLDVLPFLPPGP